MALERLEIQTREPLPGADALGVPGYTLVRATAHYGLDPANSANAGIADLELAPRTGGRVVFFGDVVVAEPPPGEPAPLLYLVANRGRAETLPLSFGVEPAGGGTLSLGDGFLLQRGFRVVWAGWQCDLAPVSGLLRLEAPLATVGGEPPEGVREVRLEPDFPTASFTLVDTRTSPASMLAFPTRDLDDPLATLSARPRSGGAFEELPRESWRFARAEAGRLVPSTTDVALEGSFQPDRIYVLRYRPAICPVNGVGLTVARDLVAALRRDVRGVLGAPASAVSSAYAYGVSQSGRYLRQFLYEGRNLDEEGAQVFDGVFAHIAGARRGDFNLRYGQLSINRSEGVGLEPPYASAHRDGGLLDTQRRVGGLPKVILTNSAFEYWRRDAAALHVEVDATKDLPEDPDVRCYLFAGTSHVVGDPLVSPIGPANPTSVLDPLPGLRALFDALVRWVESGAAPPESRVPRLGAGELVERADALAALSKIGGLALPEPSMIPFTSRSDPGEEEIRGDGTVEVADRVVSLVPALNPDGNEASGVVLPELAIPLFTHSGINPRAELPGQAVALLDLIGTSLPFAPTPASRAEDDPRHSVSERYANREAYLEAVGEAARRLTEQALLLEQDEAAVIARAAYHYDEVAALTARRS